jgi:hypothetical protein
MLKAFVADAENNGTAVMLVVSGSNPSDALAVIPVVAGFSICKPLPSANEIRKLGHRLEGMLPRNAIQITDENATETAESVVTTCPCIEISHG